MNVSRTTTWFRLLALCLLGMGRTESAAASEPAADGSAAVAYRRVLVPAERPDAWPRDGGQFLPVDAEEFAARVAAAKRPPSMAHIVDAEYSARLEGNRLVDGRGRWTIELRSPGPTLLALDTISLAVRHAAWRGQNDESALLGWWAGQGDTPTELALRVERSGVLEFDWQTPPGDVSGATLEIPLKLPAATRGRLVLRLPPDKRPTLLGAILLGASEVASPAGGADQQWEFALGQSDKLRLHVVDAASDRGVGPLDVVAHHQLRYGVTQRGLDIEDRLRLEPRGTLPRELRLLLPSGTRLVGASLDDRSLPWRIDVGANRDGPETVVSMPELPPDRPAELQLRAWGPLETGATWRLPRIDVKDAFWASASITLSVDEALELGDLRLRGCVQSGAEPAGPIVSGRTLTFDAFSPEHDLELTVVSRRVHAEARIGTSLEVGSAEVEGRVVAELTVDRGALHSVSAELMPGWTIDAVETIPAESLSQWYVDTRDGVRRLELQLRRAVTRSQGVTIVVTGRQARSMPADLLPQPGLSMLRWRDVEVARSLLRLDAALPYELIPLGPMRPLQPDELSDRDRGLFAGSGDGPVFDWRSPPAEGAFRLAPKRGSYDAQIHIDATLRGPRLRITYHAVCRPDESGIDRVLVHLSEPAPPDLRWMDDELHEQLPAERVADDDPRLAGLPRGGELWSIDLRRLYARPVTVTATTESNWSERRRVPLLALPDAAAQQGRIVVRSAEPTPPVVVALGMMPAPPPHVELNGTRIERMANALAVYRYSPNRFYAAASPPELWLGPGTLPATRAKTLAAEVSIDSYVANDGSAAHRIDYNLSKSHTDRVRLTLASGTRLESATVDGRPALVTSDDAVPGTVSIRLPPPYRNAAMVLHLRSAGPPLTNGGRLVPPLPHSEEMTLLSGVWNVHLPSEFAVVGQDSAGTDSLGWQARLFGPLARPDRFVPFLPRQNTARSGLIGTMFATPALADSPELAVAGEDTPAPEGWRAFRVPFVALRPKPITVTHPPTTSAWGLLLLLFCLVSGAAFRIRFKYWLPSVTVAALIALAIPVPYAPLATGAFLGLLAAPVFQVIWRNAARNASPTAGATTRLPILLTVAAGIGMLASTAEGESPPGRLDAAAKIHRVLIPVDSQGEPTGKTYFVDEQLFAELLRRSHDRADGSGWLLCDLRCDAELDVPPGENAARVGPWMLTFDIQVLKRDTTIHLPLVLAEATWPEVASLDGIPAPLDWDDDGRGCHIAVAEPGRYRLALRCEPLARDVAGRQTVELSVPPLVGGRIRLTCSTPRVEPRIGTRDIAVRGDTNSTVWEGEFDGSGRLIVSWATGTLDAETASSGSIEELQWLRIRRGGIELEAKYVSPTGAHQPRMLAVLIDQRWELTGVDGCELAETPRSVDGASTQIPRQLRLPAGHGERREFAMRFRLRETTVLGRLRVPTVRLTSQPAARRWLAVSTDPSLKCDAVPEAGSTNATVDDFLTAWGGAAPLEPPQFVLSRTGDSDEVHLSIAPRAIESNVEQRTNVVVGPEHFHVEYRADVEPQAGDRFRWTMDVPEGLAVESLTVEQENRDVPIEWSRAGAKRVNLFFGQAMDAAYRVRLVGSVPLGADREQSLPIVSAADAPRFVETVSVFREEGVRVKLCEPTRLSFEDLPAVAPPGVGETRFVGALVVDASAAGDVRVAVEPNEPTVSGCMLTQLDHSDGVWFARLRVTARVEQGELGTLRFEVPATWSGPFETSLAGTTRLTPESKTTAMLTARLARPLRQGGEIQFELRGPMTFTVGESVTVPPMAPKTAGNWRRFVAVPGSLQGERLSWTQAGVEPADLPRALRTNLPANYQRFRVVGDSVSVSLRPAPVQAAPAAVRLAETTVLLGPAGGQCTYTRFVLTPQRLTQCTVELPESEQLVHLEIDGRPALAQSLSPRSWRVQLGPPNFPQSLEIVTRRIDRLDIQARTIVLQRPKLWQGETPIAAELSLWTLRRPNAGGQPSTRGASPATAIELATLRLERLTSASEAATRAVVESPVADGYNWFTGWSEVLRSAQRAARNAQHLAEPLAPRPLVVEPADDPLATALARSDAWIHQLSEVFAGPDLAVPAPQPAADRNRDLWHRMPTADATCFVSDGHQDTLAVEFAPAATAGGTARLLAAVSIVALALATGWLARRLEAWRPLRQWPGLLIVAVGLAAWAWLWPGWLGLLLVAIGVAYWLRTVAPAEPLSPRD